MKIIIDLTDMDFEEMPEITEEIRRIVEDYEGATMEERMTPELKEACEVNV